MNNNLRLWIYIACGFALTQSTISMYLPSAPILMRIFHSTSNEIMMTVSILFAGYAIGQLFWGSMSDQIGRKPMFTLSLIGYLIMDIALIFSDSLIYFSIFICLLGFMTASLTGLGNAMLKDVYPKDKVKTAISAVEIVMASAPVIVPAVGAHLIVWFNWQAVFIFLAIYSAIMLLVSVFFLPETLIKNHQSISKSMGVYATYKYLLSHKHFVGFIVPLGLLFGVFIGYCASSPFIFMGYLHISIENYGWAFLFSTISYAIGALLVNRMVSRFHVSRLMIVGLCFAIIGAIFLILSVVMFNQRALIGLIASSLILMFGLGVVLPAAKIGGMTSFMQHNGAAASLMKFSQTGLCVFVVLLFSILHKTNTLFPMFLAMVIVSIMASIIFLLCHGFNKSETI